jgi:hypothetical protein
MWPTRPAAEVLDEIYEKGCVTVASVHHTGTWFALEFLLWHSQFREVVELHELISGQKLVSKEKIVHFHLTGRKIDSRGDIECDWEKVKKFVKSAKVLVPLRDPLLSLISREKRHPGGDHRFIIDGFEALSDICGDVDNEYRKEMNWLVVDLSRMLSENDRVIALKNRLVQLRLDEQPYVYRFARDWKKFNSWNDSKHHDCVAYEDAYLMNDWEWLKRQLGNNWDYLVSKMEKIRPMLIKFGYSLKWLA